MGGRNTQTHGLCKFSCARLCASRARRICSDQSSAVALQLPRIAPPSGQRCSQPPSTPLESAFASDCAALWTAAQSTSKKTKCEEVADATPTKCLNDANGGLMCCLNDVVAGAAPVPAKCVEKPKPAATEKPKPAKETTDTPLSGVAVAMTSAFAAAAAGLLL